MAKDEIEDRGDIVEEEELEEETLEDEDDEEESEESEDEDLEEDEDEGEDGESEDDEENEEEVDNQRIPRSRLNQVIKQRDEEKQRTLWLEQQLERLIEKQDVKEVKEEVSKAPEYDFVEAEEKYIDFILEGETKKASSLRNEIDKARTEQWDYKFKNIEEKAKKTAKAESSASIEDDRFDSLIENYENKYSFLNLDSDDYNEEAVETVNTLMAGYQANGKPKSQALKAAIVKVVPMFTKENPSPPKKGLGDRKKTTRKRNAKASQQQPAKTSGKKAINRDLDELKVSTLSDKDFDSLSEKEKKILRGDM